MADAHLAGIRIEHRDDGQVAAVLAGDAATVALSAASLDDLRVMACELITATTTAR